MDSFDLATLQKIAATQTPDEKAVEQAFGEQAYATLVQKCGPLMNEKYRFGFEVVDRNDDLTKLLGLWAFRLGRKSKSQMAIVPVIFMNGRILGSDLLYRNGPKKFVPNTPDWAQYIITLATQEDGQIMERSETNKLQPLLHADRILRTPDMFGKQAGDRIEDKAGLVTEMLRQVKTSGVLRDFIQNSGIGLQVIDTMMDAISKSASFARAVARTWPNCEWMPEHVKVTEKQAAQKDKVLVQLFTGEPSADLLAHAFNREKVAEDLYKQGYSLDASPDVKAPEHSTVLYSDEPSELYNPDCPSIVTLMLASGDRVEVLVGRKMDSWHLTNRDCSSASIQPGSYREFVPPRAPCNVVRTQPVDSDEGVCWSGDATLWAAAEPVEDKALAEVGIPVKDMSTDELYMLFHPETGELSDPVFILDKKQVGEVWHVGMAGHSGGESRLMVINPDARKPLHANVISAAWRAIRVPYRTHPDSQNKNLWTSSTDTLSSKRAPEWFCLHMAPATSDDIRASVEGSLSVKSATLTYCKDGTDDGYYLSVEGRRSMWMTRQAMHVKLAGRLLVDPDAAGELLDQAKQSGDVRMIMSFPEKHAAMLRLAERDNFEDTIDPIFGIRRGRDQRVTLRTQRVPIYTPPSRIGDKVDSVRGARNEPDSSVESSSSVPDHILLTSDPSQVAQYAEIHGMPNVLDHAVFGAMAKTYDSSTFITQYIAKIEEGVDFLGRCLFLYYWKPQDWKDMYGQDDLSEMEDKLLNAFKSAGDILLDLVKKSRQTSGNPVMS